MHSHRLTRALLTMGLFAMLSMTTNGDEARIGVAASIRPNVDGTVGTNSQTLTAGSELYTNETVRTGNRGRADLVFIDNTNLTVGSTSEVRLDKFVYDPTGSSGSVIINATRGAFRFVTGSQDHRAYQVRTPYGTLGVRGTTVELKVLADITRKGLPPDTCVATAKLVSGAGATFTLPSGQVAELTEVGTCVCYTAAGRVVQLDSCPSLQFAEVSDPGFNPPPPSPPPPCVSPTSKNGCAD